MTDTMVIVLNCIAWFLLGGGVLTLYWERSFKRLATLHAKNIADAKTTDSIEKLQEETAIWRRRAEMMLEMYSELLEETTFDDDPDDVEEEDVSEHDLAETSAKLDEAYQTVASLVADLKELEKACIEHEIDYAGKVHDLRQAEMVIDTVCSWRNGESTSSLRLVEMIDNYDREVNDREAAEQHKESTGAADR